MKKVVLAIIITILISVPIAGFAGYVAATNMPVVAKETPPTVGALLDAVNAERAKVGVESLVIHPILQTSAQAKVDDMWTRDYRQHFPPNQPTSLYVNGTGDAVEAACSMSSENYFYIEEKTPTTTVEGAIDWWMHSPKHKAAILDPKYTLTGFGITHDNLIVEHFCVAK